MEFLPQNIIPFIEQYGYWAILTLSLLAGPVGPLAGGFLAGIGALNPWVIWAISGFADITTDVFYYHVGKWGGFKVLNKLSRFFSWPETLRQKVEWLFHRHGRKTLVLIKFTQGIGTLTQILAGAVRMPLSVFIPYNFFSGLVYNGLLVVLGVLAGGTWHLWAERVENIGLLLGLAAAAIVAVVLSLVKIQGRYVTDKLSDEYEQSQNS